MGLPRPWDQQWSLRIQQVLAFETDLLEYPDIFEGSKVMDGLVAELVEGAREEMKIVADQGGAVEAVAYMKARLVESHRERIAKIERGRDQGDRPELLHRDRGLAAHRRRRRRHPHPRPRGRARAPRGARGVEGRARRRRRSRRRSPTSPRPRATTSVNIMPATIAAAKAGATTGEWAQTLRDVFGDYRAPDRRLGRRRAAATRSCSPRSASGSTSSPSGSATGPRILVGKPGPRRPLQRRRADRRPRPRRRHGGHLPGHPADPGADRRLRASRRTSTSSASRSSPARTSS